MKGEMLMPVLVKIPTPLRSFTNGQRTVETEGRTVSEVLKNLDAKYPGIHAKIIDPESQRVFANLYLNNDDIRCLNKEEGRYEIAFSTPVKDGDQLALIPPIAGGR